jgi:hypothetical protein
VLSFVGEGFTSGMTRDMEEQAEPEERQQQEGETLDEILMS